MLAKKMFINSIKKQKKFIESELLNEDNWNDNEYIYVGDIYPEVIAYFEKQGFIVKYVETDTYVFSIGNIELTEKELKKIYESGKFDSYIARRNARREAEELAAAIRSAHIV